MTRLETLSSDLVTNLRNASMAKQRLACIAACEVAVTKSKIEHPLIKTYFQQLRAGHVFTTEEQAEVNALVAQLDDDYLNLQEASEAGKASAAEYIQAFAKARAVAALSFACSGERGAADESIYEAAAAIGDDKLEFLSYIESVLR